MTFISASIAGILALRAGEFNLVRWLALVVGLIMAHALNNLLNDLVDYRKGVDHNNYFRTQYGSQPLEQGLWTERQLLTYAAVTGAIALACGVVLMWQRGPLAWALLAAGAFFVVFYTWPLKYVGLGELAVLIVWGPLMIGGGYYVITGQWDWNVVLASLPYALGPTTVIFGKHIDKYKEDKAKGVHTLPVIIGEHAGAHDGPHHVRAAILAGDLSGRHGFLHAGHAHRPARADGHAPRAAHVQPAAPRHYARRLPTRDLADLLRRRLFLSQPALRSALHPGLLIDAVIHVGAGDVFIP